MQISWLTIATLAIAPFIGSFLGVLVERLPREEPVVFSRSRCNACGQQLTALDLIPIFSWLRFSGRCRHCGNPIGLFPPLIELLAFGVAIWASTSASGWVLVATACLGWVLLALAIIDWRHLLLPDVLTGFTAACGLVTIVLMDLARLPHHLAGAGLGYLSLAILALAYRKLRSREGIGEGDAKLFGALGMWVSWEGLPGILLLASAMAFCVVAVRLALGLATAPHTRLPFGTFLAAGGWLVWLYGPLVFG